MGDVEGYGDRGDCERLGELRKLGFQGASFGSILSKVLITFSFLFFIFVLAMGRTDDDLCILHPASSHSLGDHFA